jgi:hypothetical protein
LAFVLSLSGLLGQAEPSPQAPAPEEAREPRPVLPGESGHILKMTREMLDLAKTRDSERRMDLFLRQAQERLREREALEKSAPASERDRLGRGLGDSYAKLTGIGAAGAIECGAAEGRDMSGAATRYVLAARRHQETWSRLAGAQPPEERPRYEGALAVSSKALERVQEAQEAGKAFLAQERARDEARSREREHEKTPEVPKAPAPPKGPSEPPSPPSEPGRRDPDGDRKDKERKEDAKEPKAPEHHETHPHRPHR